MEGKEYFALDKYVSNSDLTHVAATLYPKQQVHDINVAQKFGNLIDAMITEPHRVNYFKYTVDTEKYTKEDFDKAILMKHAFMEDGFCKDFIKGADFQKVDLLDKFDIVHSGFRFSLAAKCKWDIWRRDVRYGGDIKSTTAKSQKEFEAALNYFHYSRQRAWYMDIAGSEQDMLIGISKVNFKIFKVPIKKNDKIYLDGKKDYSYLAFRYWQLFSDF